MAAGVKHAGVKQAWATFLREPEASDHAVQTYATPAELAGSVAAYLAAGFERGEPAVVIATPELRRLVADRLAGAGWDEEAQEGGLLSAVDAEATLAAILADGRPSADRFDAVVGGLLDDVAARFPKRLVRAFGEMVDLLWRRGDTDAAVELEALWNDAAARRSFALLCGYRADPFAAGDQTSLFPAVCGAHSHVLPAADTERFQQAVNAALYGTLGTDADRVYRSVRPNGGPAVPPAQLALMWVSEHMPARAEVVLAEARRKYLRGALR